MLSINSNLLLALNNATSEPIFLLDLEYNVGGSANTLRISDRDLVFNSMQYYGIVKSFGSYHQSANILDFTTSTGTMQMAGINTPSSLKNTRFSDLFATNNFINRKWTLWLWESHLGATRSKIAMGYISDDLKFDDCTFELTLDDYTSIWSRDFPKTIINKTDYPNCPDTNIGKPIPMFYGNIDVNADAPTSTAEFDRHLVGGHFPAPITSQYNISDGALNCYPDTATLKQLRAKNIFMGKEKYFLACENANVNIASNPKIYFSGNEYRLLVDFINIKGSSNVTNTGNAIDNNFDNYATFSCEAGTPAYI